MKTIKQQQKYIDKIRIKTWNVIDNFNLIEDKDSILVGLSGGKDSLALLDIIATRKNKYSLDHKIYAVHVNVKSVPYEIDRNYTSKFCKNLNIPLHFIDIDVDFEQESKKSSCFICSWHRRKAMFDLAGKLNCNKIALGHHMDDAVETLLMNMMYHASISSMPIRLKMFNDKVELIRPLLYIKNEQIKEYAEYQEFIIIEKTCPYEDSTKRKQINNIMKNMEALENKSIGNIFYSMSNIFDEYIPKEKFRFRK